MAMDQDGDEIMLSEAHQSQLTQSVASLGCYIDRDMFLKIEIVFYSRDTNQGDVITLTDQIPMHPLRQYLLMALIKEF